MIVGVDEAGVGSLMSVMVAGAVILPKDYNNPQLTDSKKLTEKTRKKLSDEIREKAYFGIGVVTNEEIDFLGLARCRRLVFHRALDDLFTKTSEEITKIIVDGTLFEKYKDFRHECIPKADLTVPCVSAASVIAKHFRDEYILQICNDNTEYAQRYDWAKNKGYPAPKHLQAIKDYGVTPFHRLSYGPCKQK